jgi:hypothetical protein
MFALLSNAQSDIIKFEYDLIVPTVAQLVKLTPNQSIACSAFPVASRLIAVPCVIARFRIGMDQFEDRSAVLEDSPVEIRMQFSEDPPMIVVFWLATSRSPVRSTVPVIK